jgi:phosphatidate cytidylyltransferase
MKLRIITGVLAGIALILLIFFAQLWAITTVVMGAAVLAYLEYDRLFFPYSVGRRARMLFFILITLFLLHHNQIAGWFAFWLTFVVNSAIHVVHSDRTGDFFTETREMSLEMLGYLYVISLLGFIVPIADMPHGRMLLFQLFLLVFSGDTAAYFVGMKMGKHKLAGQLSPKKSIEGAIAAVVVSTIATSTCAFFWFRGVGQEHLLFKVLIFTPVASVLAQLGDLFESMFKRSQSQKDSGNFLPGHGGILDRIDGLALISPIYYLYLLLVLERT